MATQDGNDPSGQLPNLPSDPSDMFKGHFDPSQYSLDNERLPMILYNRINEKFIDDIKNDTFDNLKTFHGSNVAESLQEIVDAVDSQTYEQLINSKKKILNDFILFIRQRIPIRTAYSVAGQWAPPIPKLVEQTENVLHLIIRLCNIAQDGNKVLYWLSNALFPKNFTKKSSLVNSRIVAICRCICLPSHHAYWAVLSTDRMFRLYMLRRGGPTLEFECKVSATRVHDDKKSVIIVDSEGNDAQMFMPVDINQAQMWGAALLKQHSPFPYYLSSYQVPLPAEYYHALYEAIRCPDLIIVRCATHPTVTNPASEYGHELMESLFDIFCHASRVPLLLNQMLAIDFYHDFKAIDFLKKPTNCGNLINVFIERFCGPFYDDFVRKLSDYISINDCFAGGLNADAADIEPRLNTAMKYIYTSAPAIPSEIKHVAQVVFAYATCKFNNKQDILQCLSNFYLFRVLIALLQHPDIYGGRNKNARNISGFVEIAKVIFRFGELSGSLRPLNDRMQHNIYPRLERFLYGIGQPTSSPVYQGISDERFVKVIESVLRIVSRKSLNLKEEDAFIQFVQRFNDAALPTFPEPLGITGNLHFAISRYFKYRIDSDIESLPEGEIDAPQNYFKSEQEENGLNGDLEGGFPPMPNEGMSTFGSVAPPETLAAPKIKASRAKKGRGKKGVKKSSPPTIDNPLEPPKKAGPAKKAGRGKKKGAKKTSPPTIDNPLEPPKKAGPAKKAGPKKGKRAAPKKAAPEAPATNVPTKKGGKKKAASKKAAAATSIPTPVKPTKSTKKAAPATKKAAPAKKGAAAKKPAAATKKVAATKKCAATKKPAAKKGGKKK